jgi:hypothetical protein
MPNPATSVLGIGRDFGRVFRERPALVVGGGVLILLGVALLNRRAPDEAGPVADPAAGLFPGVTTYGGGEVPGSGSVPFAGYPVAGDGAYAAAPTPAPGFDFPLPSWGLSCNGEPKPSISGLPGSWTCTDDGWQYVPPPTSSLPTLPAPSPTPTPTPTGATYLYAQVRAGTYNLYAIVSGRARLIGSFVTGGFNAECVLVTATQADGSGTTTLVRFTTGVHAGKIVWRDLSRITITTRTR